jgi:hypothetical protein
MALLTVPPGVHRHSWGSLQSARSSEAFAIPKPVKKNRMRDDRGRASEDDPLQTIEAV